MAPRACSSPARPSEEEVSNHMLCHLPFRSWCPHCVRGKAKGKPHMSARGRTRDIPTVCVDYMFMTERQSEGEEHGAPIVVVKDSVVGTHGTGMVFARVVPAKGVQPYAVRSLSHIVGLLGHGEIVLKK